MPGCRAARELAASSARRGFAIVSGGALGIDAAAHRGALDAGGATFAVLGCGVDVVYPDRHAALFADIAARGRPASPSTRRARRRARGQFPARNRIIAALAETVLVVEAGLASGALDHRAARASAGRRAARRAGQPGHRRADRRRARARPVADADALAALSRARRRAPAPIPPRFAALLAALARRRRRRRPSWRAAWACRLPRPLALTRGSRARRLALPSPGRRAGIYGGYAWQLRRRQPPSSTRPTRSRKPRRPTNRPSPPRRRRSPRPRRPRSPRPPRGRPRPPPRRAEVEGVSQGQGRQGEGQRGACRARARAQRQRAGDRRVARQGEDDQEVPGRRLHREGVGRPREGSARRRRWASTSSTASSPSTWSSTARRRCSPRSRRRREDVGRVYLAPDPDREGEAIAWHIAEEIRESNTNIQRVLFNEITKKAVTEAHRAARSSST